MDVQCQGKLIRTGEQCPARAAWIVAVGTRKIDEQAACGNHLHDTCRVMAYHEERPGVRLTVRRA